MRVKQINGSQRENKETEMRSEMKRETNNDEKRKEER
jgi:hypothetical protein